MNLKSRFLSEGEANELLVSRCKHDISDYYYRPKFKVYPAAEFIIYRFDSNDKLVILTICKVLEVGLNAGGVYCKVLDKREAQVYTITHTPKPLCGYDVYTHIPQRVEVERSFKELEDGRTFESVAVAIRSFFKSNPVSRNPDQDNFIGLNQARRVLGDELEEAMERLEDMR